MNHTRCHFLRFVLRQLSTLVVLALATGTSLNPLPAAQPSELFELWPPGKAPGATGADPSQGEQLVTSRRRTFDQYTNIAIPKVAVFLAPEEKRTGSAVVVCPGGGMQRLAYEHEGVEIADWLNPLGISVFVLKYRVPSPSSTALLDVQRAVGLIRSRADEFHIDGQRLGIMGFSAGGEVALLLATHNDRRGYEPIDAADQFSCRPASACLVYPGGLVSRSGELRADIADKLDASSTPEMFIVHAFMDASINSLALALELKKKNVGCEMHIYREGGHGFGARESALPLSGWKASYIEWIRAQGFLDPSFVSSYAMELAERLPAATSLRPLTDLNRLATLDNGYAVQRLLVKAQNSADTIAGYKAGFVTAAAQQSVGLTGPMTGVLFRSGWTAADEIVQLDLSTLGPTAIETELGFIVSRGLDIATHISTEKQIKGAFDAIVPVIELPIDLKSRMSGELRAADIAAANIGSKKYLVASTSTSPDDYRPSDLHIVLKMDGKPLHQVEGDAINAGLWSHLITVVNQIVDQGYTLRSGDIVIAGALGTVHIAEPGHYSADYGGLGQIDFTIK
ncbi:MAG: alpha/beta hydrolase fold domain-containing protein [Planctomycetales bacterium]|nr:alpha/beta hydrolase fold domain-containing protein [Planctomycetales bacterium]